jgi:maltose O-acetyltransferase
MRSLRRAGLRIGHGATIGPHTYIDKGYAWAIVIGDDVTISWDVSIIAHDAAGWHHTGYTEVKPVTIGNNSYIGAGCTILPGASIGDGSIIGAGSVVRGEIPAESVAAGVPCRVISSVSDYVARYRSQDASAPHFEKMRHEMNAGDIALLARAIQEHGRAFIR